MVDVFNDLIDKLQGGQAVYSGVDGIIEYFMMPPYIIIPRKLDKLSADGVKWQQSTLHNDLHGINYNHIKARSVNSYVCNISLFPTSTILKSIQQTTTLIDGTLAGMVLSPYSTFMIQVDAINDKFVMFYYGLVNKFPPATSYDSNGINNYELEIVFFNKIELVGMGKLFMKFLIG